MWRERSRERQQVLVRLLPAPGVSRIESPISMVMSWPQPQGPTVSSRALVEVGWSHVLFRSSQHGWGQPAAVRMRCSLRPGLASAIVA